MNKNQWSILFVLFTRHFKKLVRVLRGKNEVGLVFLKKMGHINSLQLVENVIFAVYRPENRKYLIVAVSKDYLDFIVNQLNGEVKLNAHVYHSQNLHSAIVVLNGNEPSSGNLLSNQLVFLGFKVYEAVFNP